MKWSFRVARLAGIDVHVHATFGLLLAFVGFSDYREGGLVRAVDGIVFVLALFVCIVLHELGHALAARGFGIATRDITLLPIGGVARLERMPERPLQELWVALAGPLVNVIIAGALLIGLLLSAGLSTAAVLAETGGRFLERMMYVNAFLVVFNMLPAFPMDGGRVLRALLATRLRYVTATRAAARIGQGMGVLFGIAGFFVNPFLLLIGVFVWMGAAQEAAAVEVRAALRSLPVQAVMLRRFHVLAPHALLGEALYLLRSGLARDIPVVHGRDVLGMLRRSDVAEAAAGRDPGTPVETLMRRDFPAVRPTEPLDDAVARILAADWQSAPVVIEGYGLVGLLTPESIREYLADQGADGRRPVQARIIAEPTR